MTDQSSSAEQTQPKAARGWAKIAAELAAPFGPGEIHYRAGATTAKRGPDGKYPPGTKAQKLPYIDARDVEERLDHVIGPSRWQDSYVIVDPPTLAVQCGIGIQMADGTWVWKYDVGYPNAAADANDADREPLKASYSDAFKRAAVKWRIGRHIYSMRREWAEIDERGRFKEQA